MQDFFHQQYQHVFRTCWSPVFQRWSPLQLKNACSMIWLTIWLLGCWSALWRTSHPHGSCHCCQNKIKKASNFCNHYTRIQLRKSRKNNAPLVKIYWLINTHFGPLFYQQRNDLWASCGCSDLRISPKQNPHLISPRSINVWYIYLSPIGDHDPI